MKKSPAKRPIAKPQHGYTGLISGIGELLESARHATARVVNSFMTDTYWEVARRIVELEQGGKKRADVSERASLASISPASVLSTSRCRQTRFERQCRLNLR
jgi:hypothetical protein